MNNKPKISLVFRLVLLALTLTLTFCNVYPAYATETPTFGWQAEISHTENWVKVDFTNIIGLTYCKSDLSDVNIGSASYAYKVGNSLWVYQSSTDPITLKFGNYYNSETWNMPSTANIETWSDDFSGWTFGNGASQDNSNGNPAPSISLPVASPNAYAEKDLGYTVLKGTLSWDMYGVGGSGEVAVYVDDTLVATVTSTADTWESKSLTYSGYSQLQEFGKIRFVMTGTVETRIDNITVNGVQVSSHDSVTLTSNDLTQLNSYYICKFYDETGTAWSDFATYTLTFTSPITNTIDSATIFFGVSTQPTRITVQIAKGESTNTRGLPVTSNLQTLEFYLADPTTQSQYNIFIEELGAEIFNGGELWVYMRIGGVTKLLTVSDFTEQDGKMTRVLLTSDVYYTLYVKKGSESFAAGSWYAGSTLDHTITIVVVPLQPATEYKQVSWSVSRGSNGEVYATGRLSSPADCTIKVYWRGGTLMDEYTYYSVTLFNYVWNAGNQSETYTVILEVPSLGFKEAKIAGMGFLASHPGYRVWLPLLGSVNPQIFSAAILFSFMLTITSRYKGIMTLLCVTLAALFTYFGWLDINITLIYVLILFAILYAFWRKEGEAYES